jgi:hypothetical protein
MIRYGKSAAFFSAALVMLIAFGWFFVARVQAQTPLPTPLVIQGQLLNGTHDAPPDSIANVPVTLFQITQRGPITVTQSTDTQGKFTFTNVITDATSYFTRVDYAGVVYFSDILPRDAIATAPISMTVYETQTMPADFRFDRVHLILDVQPKAFNSLALVQVTNPTDRAFYVPLPVPDKTSDVRLEDIREQTRVQRQADGTVLYPILPTTTEILYGLVMPFAPPNYTLTMPLKNGVDGINLLITKMGDVRASGNNLTPSNPFTSQSGQVYLVYAAPPQNAGTVFTATISNLPGADNTHTVQTVILVGGGLGGLALLVLPFYRRRMMQSKASAANLRAAQLQAIARLDEAYARAEIDESEYQTERAALKAELLKDALREQEAGSSTQEAGSREQGAGSRL